MLRNLTYKNFSFGYTFGENKEIISLIFINYFFILVFSIIVILLYTTGETFLPVTYRYPGIIIMCVINLFLIRAKHPKIARLSLLSLFPVLIMLMPQFAGLANNEFYFWFPYVPIGLSLIAHLTLHPKKDRLLLLIILTFYLFLGLFIDNIMIFISTPEQNIIPIVEANKFYYNLIPVLLYIFVNISIGLILRQNNVFEERLQHDSQIMEEANRKLSVQKKQLLEKNRDLDKTLKQLYETRDKLVQSEKLAALGTLTAGIAHEINNPLNFISASLAEMESLVKNHSNLFESAEDESLLDHYLELMKYAEEGVERVSDIVSKLGMLKTRRSQKAKNIRLTDLIQSALTEIQSKIPPFIRVINEIDELLMLKCINSEIQQVLVNILSNAVDAISSKENNKDERIIIRAGDELIKGKNFTTISISNTGPHIPESDILKLFDPFHTTKMQGKGIGLGLSLSFNYVQQHHGMLSAENAGDSVVFKISLPLE